MFSQLKKKYKHKWQVIKKNITNKITRDWWIWIYYKHSPTLIKAENTNNNETVSIGWCHNDIAINSNNWTINM